MREIDLADIPPVAWRPSAAAAAGGSGVVDLTGLLFVSCGSPEFLVRAQKMTRALGGDPLLTVPQGRPEPFWKSPARSAPSPDAPTVRQTRSGAAPALLRLAW